MKNLALVVSIATLAFAVAASCTNAPTAPKAPTKAAKNITEQCSRSGYMVAYRDGVAVDSTYGCTQ